MVDLASRADLLGLLAVALRPPTDRAALAECLEELRHLSELSQETGPLEEAAERLLQDARVEQEYHRLFLGPTKPIAPPFESVYVDGRAFGPSTAAFLEDLESFGLQPVGEFRLPSDHIAVELEFLVFLLRQTEQALTEGRHGEASEWSERARSFVEGHLERWLPAFLARLEAAAPESPYTAFVRAAARLIGLSNGPSKPRSKQR